MHIEALFTPAQQALVASLQAGASGRLRRSCWIRRVTGLSAKKDLSGSKSSSWPIRCGFSDRRLPRQILAGGGDLRPS